MNLPSQRCETRLDYVFQTCVREKLSTRLTFVFSMTLNKELLIHDNNVFFDEFVLPELDASTLYYLDIDYQGLVASCHGT